MIVYYPMIDLKPTVGHVAYASWSTNFALHIENHLMYEMIALDNDLVWPNVWTQTTIRSQ